MLDKLTSKDFSPYLNQVFRIHIESSEPLEIELIEVNELDVEPKEGAEAGRRRAFSVIFRGAPDIYLPQRIYQVEHDRLGSLDLFLVPLGPDKVGMRFEAVFT